MDHMDRGNHSCEGLETLHHTCTHTSFIPRIGVSAFLCLASTWICVFFFLSSFCPCCCVTLSPLLCFPRKDPVQTTKFPTILLLFCSKYLNPLPLLSFLTLSQPHSLLNIISTEISRYYQLIFIVASILNSTLWSSINTLHDGKDISWHQRAELCYPLSSCIHFCSRHAQTLFVLLFIGMYLTVWQCCVCEQSCLCSVRQLTLVYRGERGNSALLSLLLKQPKHHLNEMIKKIQTSPKSLFCTVVKSHCLLSNGFSTTPIQLLGELLPCMAICVGSFIWRTV